MKTPSPRPLSSIRSLAAALALIGASCALGALAGCERLEAAPEPEVVFQASGTFQQNGQEPSGAVLLMREERGGLLTLEVQRAEASGAHALSSVASATLDVRTFSELTSSARGALQAKLSHSTLRVSQPCGIEKPLLGARIAGQDAPGAVFRLKGGRWLEYNWGMLKRGLEGRVQVEFAGAGGEALGRFDGMAAEQPLARERGKVHSLGQLAVATRVAGRVEGSYWLGGTLFGGGNPATVEVNLPNGAGRVELAGRRQSFDFDPASDVAAAGGSMQITAQSDASLEAQDSFLGHIRVPHVDFNDAGDSDPAKVGSGSGELSYAVSLSIDPFRVITTTRITVNAAFDTHGGRHLGFVGSDERIQTELAW